MREIVETLSLLPYCFTQQCCSGHFVVRGHPQLDSLVSLPRQDAGGVTYRIAYLALCLQGTAQGKALYAELAHIPSIDPEYVQFGSPRWFSRRYRNSYALQVEPTRFMYRDQAELTFEEARHVEEVRDLFVDRLRQLVRSLRAEGAS